MERMKQMYVEAIEMADKMASKDPRFRPYLDFALERMELGLELNIPKLFGDGVSDLNAASIILHHRTFHGAALA